MTLKIEVQMDTAAFEEREGVETARILHEFARSIQNTLYGVLETEKFLYDVNGNSVGKAKVTK